MSESDRDSMEAPNSASSIPPLGDEAALASYADEKSPDSMAKDETTLYKYRDFGHVAEDDEELGSEVPSPQVQTRGSESSIRVQKFPVKLYAILAQKEFQDIICWMPHGRSWKVLKPSLFESLVMPLFFEYSNYHSFNRLVNAWSFRRISSGPDRGSYYHELFLRGKPHLQKYMRRLPKTHKKLPMKKKDEPDFYKLDQSNPLPQIHEAPIPGAAATVQAMRASGSALMVGSGMSGMTHHPSSPQVITPPHLSPNQPSPNLINGGSSSMMGPSDGMGGLGGMMSGMGRASMGTLHGMGDYGMPGGGRGLGPRYGGGGYDSYGMRPEDDFDLRPRLGRADSGTAHYGGQSSFGSSVHPYGRGGGQSELRRPSGRHGNDSVFERSSPSSPNDYYGNSSYPSQHQMMPPMNSSHLYGRGDSGTPDDYPSPPLNSNVGGRR